MVSKCSDERLEDYTYAKRMPGAYSDMDEDGKPYRQRKPSFRTVQKQEKIAPQKWVQCAKCELWRKVTSLNLQGNEES